MPDEKKLLYPVIKIAFRNSYNDKFLFDLYRPAEYTPKDAASIAEEVMDEIIDRKQVVKLLDDRTISTATAGVAVAFPLHNIDVVECILYTKEEFDKLRGEYEKFMDNIAATYKNPRQEDENREQPEVLFTGHGVGEA